MDEYITYILISTSCLSICYLVYLLLLREKAHLPHLRWFLLASMLFSLVGPLTDFRISLMETEEQGHRTDEVLQIGQLMKEGVALPSVESETSQVKIDSYVGGKILEILYFFIASVFLVRIQIHTFNILRLYSRSRVVQQGNVKLLFNKGVESPFTFFNWIFLPEGFSENSKTEEILIHEKIHASQYHTIDLILIELLLAAMWFNPLVWKMRKSVQLVHEYLADEGVLRTGTDKLKYQALLINQVAEDKLICFSSSFNHSLIKKRMIMMTKNKFGHGSKLRILSLVPLAILLFIGVACVNGQNTADVVTAIEPVRMNVLYLGVDNPIKISTSGLEASELVASVDNGKISGQNGEYIIRPKKRGEAIVTVKNKQGEEIRKSKFRVKVVPDPIVKIDGAKNGKISREDLLKLEEVKVLLPNFDFDMSFKVVSFAFSVTIEKGYIAESKSKSNKFTAKQKKLFKEAISGKKIYIDEVKCMGPDGRIRQIGSRTFILE